jgi:hypothetical protein
MHGGGKYFIIKMGTMISIYLIDPSKTWINQVIWSFVLYQMIDSFSLFELVALLRNLPGVNPVFCLNCRQKCSTLLYPQRNATSATV